MQSLKQPSTSKDAPKITNDQESFEEHQRRCQAARILESQEQLIWHSMARNEDVPQTRRYFRAIAAGMDPSKVTQNSSGHSGFEGLQSARKGTARVVSRSDKSARPLDPSSIAKRKLADP
ncbi:hypothetical protein BDZ85DRAFT_23206 [Elsinoe ampelina]|uniref:Uncharacterized protein n=1 Tax=Elsinoe ampelina TaxID=302913 RepID=A0A6A6G5J6_9PEZI|nr:hypothetical protein BDZ85DRAFT_23206 [Elsinoe ampelina]